MEKQRVSKDFPHWQDAARHLRGAARKIDDAAMEASEKDREALIAQARHMINAALARIGE